MLTTLPCFVEFHIFGIGHLWQIHWMMIWLWSVIGALGGVCWWIPARHGDAYFSFSYGGPLFPDLVIDGSVVELVSELKILGVILNSKLASEKQVRAIAASASRRVGIWRKTMSVFRDVAVMAKCFWAFILPVLEYCSTVWMSAATSHLLLLERAVCRISQLSGGSVSCDLWHRRKVASLCVFFKIDSLVGPPVRSLFRAQYAMRRSTRGVWLLTLDLLRCLGVELCSFHALSFCPIFDCGMGCMSLSFLVKACVILKFQSIAFFYKIDCPLFLPALQLFLFHIPFSRYLREHGGPLNL